MTPEKYLLSRLVLPGLKLEKVLRISNKIFQYHCTTKRSWENCRKCPSRSFTIYDHRTVTIRDAKVQNKNIVLVIKKKRFKCPTCGAVFTEIVDGIKLGFRTTEKYRQDILYNFKRYECAKGVAAHCRCSDTLVTKVVNERLDLELRKSMNTPWGKTVLMDEHGFRRHKKQSRKEFVTSFVDNNRKCLREVAQGKREQDLFKAIEHIPGRDKVSHVVIDMDTSYKNSAKELFPNSQIVIDKFHVIRLIHPAIRKYRKEATGDKRSNPIRHLLLKNRKRLKTFQKRAVTRFCNENPTVNEVYRFKERISSLFNIKGYKQARKSFIAITDDLGFSKIAEMHTLRNTLLKWKDEILNYFKTGLSGARVEGFIRKCKLIQRKAYGFRNFENYRLRVLYYCS